MDSNNAVRLLLATIKFVACLALGITLKVTLSYFDPDDVR